MIKTRIDAKGSTVCNVCLRPATGIPYRVTYPDGWVPPLDGTQYLCNDCAERLGTGVGPRVVAA